eukprot:1161481-Pelagomonas_calceolata.AAC.6
MVYLQQCLLTLPPQHYFSLQFGGTIRTLDHDTMVHLQGRLESLAAAIAAGFGCTTSLDWRLNEQPVSGTQRTHVKYFIFKPETALNSLLKHFSGLMSRWVACECSTRIRPSKQTLILHLLGLLIQ